MLWKKLKGRIFSSPEENNFKGLIYSDKNFGTEEILKTFSHIPTCSVLFAVSIHFKILYLIIITYAIITVYMIYFFKCYLSMGYNFINSHKKSKIYYKYGRFIYAFVFLVSSLFTSYIFAPLLFLCVKYTLHSFS